MTPFILKQHEKDRAQLMELKASEIQSVSGGLQKCPSPDDIPKGSTVTVTPSGDGGDDGCDQG